MYVETKTYETLEAGTYTGILYSVIDLGTQENKFDPDDIKYAHRIQLTFELDEKMKDGRPFVVSKEYTLSWHPKAQLTALLKSWQDIAIPKGKGFDISTLLGKAGNVSVALNEKGYPKLMTVSALKKSEKAPAQVNPTVDFWLAQFDQKVFESLPEWIQNKIALSPEYAEILNPKLKTEVKQASNVVADLDDEIPF